MLLKIIGHLGLLIHTERDVQTLIGDLVTGKAKIWDSQNKADVKAVIQDLKDIVDAGLIVIPGLDQATLDKVMDDVMTAIGG